MGLVLCGVVEAMKSKATLAEVLRYAADVVLDPATYPAGPCTGKLRQYSCDAFTKAVEDLHPEADWQERESIQTVYRAGAKELGIDLTCTCVYADWPVTERQGARYMWLDLAALMAEEQGV